MEIAVIIPARYASSLFRETSGPDLRKAHD